MTIDNNEGSLEKSGAAQAGLTIRKIEVRCSGMGSDTGHRCCDRAGEYNGFSSGPLLFVCTEHCPCHD